LIYIYIIIMYQPKWWLYNANAFLLTHCFWGRWVRCQQTPSPWTCWEQPGRRWAAAPWVSSTLPWSPDARRACLSTSAATSISSWRTCREPVGRRPLLILLTRNGLDSLIKELSCVSLTGSFKIRGVANQFARRPRGCHFVTMSAGNYGKSFAYASKHYGSKGKVVMPETAPVSRSILIQVWGYLTVSLCCD